MKLHPLVLALGLIPLVGCNGSSNSSAVEVTTETYSIRAVDGYLYNALVWLDINGDCLLDKETEPYVNSDKEGIALLDVSNVTNPDSYPVVVKAIAGQTVDKDTMTESNPDGVAITTPFLLSAPAGQTVVTPLSTLVSIKMSNDTSLTMENAKAAVATELGIPENDLLGDYIATDQGDIAAKANALVELAVLPASEQDLQDVMGDNSSLDEQLAENLQVVQALTEDQRLVMDEDGTAHAALNIDSDDDGIIDERDNFPNDASEWVDSDADGMGDNHDLFPQDPTETIDSDNDGMGDNHDAFPLNPAETTDSDSDGMGDNHDAFPLNPAETTDSDDDGMGDNQDAFPLNPAETTDSDNDGMGDNQDAFPQDPTETLDTDGDGFGDNADNLLLGSWSNRSISVTFNPDSTYHLEQKLVEDEDDDALSTGIEEGSYALDETSGEIMITNITLDDNGIGGFSDYDEDGNLTLIFDDSAENHLAFSYHDADEQAETFEVYKTIATSATDFYTSSPNYGAFYHEDDQFTYDDVQWDSSDNSIVSLTYQFNAAQWAFTLDEPNEAFNYMLTADGWVDDSSDRATLSPQSDGSMHYATNTGQSAMITGQQWLLANKNINDFLTSLSSEGEFLPIDENVTFSDGASVYEAIITPNQPEPIYNIYLGSCDQYNAATMLDSEHCNSVLATMLSGLSAPSDLMTETIAQITAPSSFVNGTDPRSFAGFYWGGQAMRLVEDGSVDIYSLYWGDASGENMSSTKIDGVVTWERITVNEQTLIIFNTEVDNLSAFNDLFITEIGGYVRTGEIESNDDSVELTLFFNDVAKDEIVSAVASSTPVISPSSAIMGSWLYSEGENRRNVLTFIDEQHYIIIHEHADGAENGGQAAGSVEYGSYNWDVDNGDFSVSLIAESDGWGGLYDDGSNITSAMVNDNALVLQTLDEGSFTLNRIINESVPLIGGWIMSDNVLVFLSESEYTIAHWDNDNGQPLSGEFGTYTLDEEANFKVTSVSVNSDDGGGLYNPSEVSDQENETLVLQGTSILFTDDDEGSFSFERIGD